MQAGGGHMHRDRLVGGQLGAGPCPVAEVTPYVAVGLDVTERKVFPIQIHSLVYFYQSSQNRLLPGPVTAARRFPPAIRPSLRCPSFSVGREQRQFAGSILSHQDHALRKDSAQLPRFEVDEHQHLTSGQLLGFVMLGDTRHDRPAVDAGVDGEFEQFFRLGDFLGLDNRRHTDIHFAEIVKRDVFFLRFGLRLASLAGHIGFFGIGQFLQLGFDDAVLDLLEQPEHRLADPVSGRDECGISDPFPTRLADAQQTEDFFRRERHERFDGHGERRGDLQRDVEDRLHPFGIGLDELPRFGVGQIFVTQPGNVHRLFERFAEAVVFDILFERFLDDGKFGQYVAVVVGRLAACGHLAAVDLRGSAPARD